MVLYLSRGFSHIPSTFFGLGGHRIGGQPSQHFFAFFAEADFHLTAVLFGLTLGLAEHPYELFELGHIHLVHPVILGHIRPLVAVGVALVHAPDALESGLALAHVAGHQRKGGSLDGDVTLAEAYIGGGAVVGAVVGRALDAHIGAEVVLAGDACVLCGAEVGDGVSVHVRVSLPLISDTIIAPVSRVVNRFLKKSQKNFLNIYT